MAAKQARDRDFTRRLRAKSVALTNLFMDFAKLLVVGMPNLLRGWVRSIMSGPLTVYICP